MRKILSIAQILFLGMHFVPEVFGADSVAVQVAVMPTGARIEVRLKNKLRLQGTRGDVSDSGFNLLNPGTGDRKLAFDDVDSVKQLKTHTTRNILIGVGIGVVAVVAVVAIVFIHEFKFGQFKNGQL